jgi:hypothetical protein
MHKPKKPTLIKTYAKPPEQDINLSELYTEKLRNLVLEQSDEPIPILDFLSKLGLDGIDKLYIDPSMESSWGDIILELIYKKSEEEQKADVEKYNKYLKEEKDAAEELFKKQMIKYEKDLEIYYNLKKEELVLKKEYMDKMSLLISKKK